MDNYNKTTVIDVDVDAVEQNNNIDEAIFKTVNIGSIVGKEQLLKTKKVNKHSLQYLNPYYLYFPNFYKKELKNAKITCWFWILLAAFFFIGATVLTVMYVVNKGNLSHLWFYILLVPVTVIFLALMIVYITRYRFFAQEAHDINFKDSKVLPINVIKLYKRLKTNYIFINWMSGLSYLLVILSFILLFFSSLILNGWNIHNAVGEMINIKLSNDIFIAFITIVGVFVITVILQFVMIINNYYRATRIDNYYNCAIVSAEELKELKKANNRKGLIIFLICLLIFGLVAWMVIKLVRRKRAKTTNVIIK